LSIALWYSSQSTGGALSPPGCSSNPLFFLVRRQFVVKTTIQGLVDAALADNKGEIDYGLQCFISDIEMMNFAKER